jgi:hypothetical protein
MDNQKLNSIFESLKNEDQIFLNYLRAKFPLFHNSNFFHKDFEYGIIGFLEKKGTKINYKQAEELSKLLSDYYVSRGIFVKTSSQGWKLNYPEFTTTKPGDPFSF